MKILFVSACCAFLAGCSTYVPPQQDPAVLITRDSMRTFRPLPREERRVSTCTMNVATRVATCR
ncbi:conserved hypothetical protein [Hyphomicrobiales bacterium]|nr:conserved hypothetical protein [Hyphomicrobiales bacterium]